MPCIFKNDIGFTHRNNAWHIILTARLIPADLVRPIPGIHNYFHNVVFFMVIFCASEMSKDPVNMVIYIK